MLTANFNFEVGEYAELVLTQDNWNCCGLTHIILVNGLYENGGMHAYAFHPKTGDKVASMFIKRSDIVSITSKTQRLQEFKALIAKPNRPPVVLNWTFEDLMPLKQFEYVEYKGDVLYLQHINRERVLATCIKRGQVTEHREYRYNENDWFLYDSSKIGETVAVIRASCLNPAVKDIHDVEWKPMY
jgi:hypothetical protein